ncbi:MAG TPA: hypothetical protein VGM54_08605 [Chthoniobacter sp.]|jgi:hypothetical protein
MSSDPTPTPAPVHHKLPGGGVHWTGRGKLWLGDDHLFEVTTLFVVESYRRFFFREIKALTVRRTKARLIWALVLGGLGLLFALVTAGFAWSGFKSSAVEVRPLMYGMAIIFAPLAVLCLTLLGFNLALGPSCRCYVLTATGWHALAAPSRLGPAVQVQARIIPIIEAAQGGAPDSETAAPYQGTS